MVFRILATLLEVCLATSASCCQSSCPPISGNRYDPNRCVAGDDEYDLDNDGGTSREGDCDNEDPTVTTGVVWLPDADNHRMGRNRKSVIACTPPIGNAAREGCVQRTRVQERLKQIGTKRKHQPEGTESHRHSHLVRPAVPFWAGNGHQALGLDASRGRRSIEVYVNIGTACRQRPESLGRDVSRLFVDRKAELPTSRIRTP